MKTYDLLSWTKVQILLVLFFLCCGGVYAQKDKTDLLCRKWKVKKIIVDGSRNRNKLIDDHMEFRKNLEYRSYDSQDQNRKFITGGKWSLDKFGNIITNPNNDKENKLKIIKLKENLFVYQLNLKESIWEVYMTPEDE